MTKEEILKKRYTLKDIYGKNSCYEQVKVGDKYKFSFTTTSKEALLAGKCYLEITITHIRSEVVFYTIEGYPEKEFHCDLKSIMVAYLEPQNPDIVLINQLKEFYDNILKCEEFV